jgi:hypothetical protein
MQLWFIKKTKVRIGADFYGLLRINAMRQPYNGWAVGMSYHGRRKNHHPKRRPEDRLLWG